MLREASGDSLEALCAKFSDLLSLWEKVKAEQSLIASNHVSWQSSPVAARVGPFPPHHHAFVAYAPSQPPSLERYIETNTRLGGAPPRKCVSNVTGLVAAMSARDRSRLPALPVKPDHVPSTGTSDAVVRPPLPSTHASSARAHTPTKGIELVMRPAVVMPNQMRRNKMSMPTTEECFSKSCRKCGVAAKTMDAKLCRNCGQRFAVT